MRADNDLYDQRYEHDACGVGFVAHLSGQKTHTIVEQAVQVLQNLVHRGASADDGRTGDGAGILVQIPDDFFRRAGEALRIPLPPPGTYAAGMFFLPRDERHAGPIRQIVESAAGSEGFRVLGWRDVPVNDEALGERARAESPRIAQCFLAPPAPVAPPDFERRLYVARKRISHAVEQSLHLGDAFYIPSLSSRTVVYKGMMMGNHLAAFYRDLTDPTFVSALAVVHQRYSTNTFPSWKLAQPFRYLAHNGEINTLDGNRNQMRSREQHLASSLLGSDIAKILPVIEPGGSDSACLDNALELLVACGRDLPHAMLMLIPQAWGLKYPIGPDLRGFFEYHSGLMEPWDGPAAVAFTNGVHVGAMLDRNGLRPARYTITRQGFIVAASETGVLDFDPADILEKGSLRPGQMILADTERGRVLRDDEIKSSYMRRHPYRRWVEENKISLHGLFNDVAPVTPDTPSLLRRQSLFGYSREELDLVLTPMASAGQEAVGSMGYDAPLAAFSEKPQLLYSYFKQRFAQVTNPAIDPIREELVMSLMTFMGNPPNILTDDPRNARLVKLRHPILSNEDVERIRHLNLPDFAAVVLPMSFPDRCAGYQMEESLERLCQRVEAAAPTAPIIVLTDRNLPEHEAPLPALLAVSAANQRLVRRGLRTRTSLVVETGEARDVHHVALLLGYGATAINPYLAFETVAEMALRKVLDADIGVATALENYIRALCKGLLKIMSKMGISTLRSYRGAHVFEAVGLQEALVRRFFTDTPSRVGGIGLDEIAVETGLRVRQARETEGTSVALLPSGGCHRFRRDGERHLWTPETITHLQRAVREDRPEFYREYARRIDDQSAGLFTLRGALRLRPATPVPVEEVEPVESICRRFVTSAMSFGSISREAHETLAIAMNRLGAASNSGEGGEDPDRYHPLPNGDNRCSAVKQVASGRFGVTIEYLVNARELQIKIAQGAKPGEGGQLPGHKVNEEIARVRHSTPGVTLISPPPHHDIYSIEDIKQLIFDLRNANPKARISVKLVSEAGVGTVAAGVAKGGADVVLISGFDGGTGASPLSSIRHAGAPWELGLAETQHTLVRNRLRGRVRLQVDGQMRTGRDVVIAALLGAEEFGFASAPLVVCGCVMMRKCHQNTCAMGVATQDPQLRARFQGNPEHVIRFFRMVAQDVREHLARLGFRKLDDIVGRSDLLEKEPALALGKARGLDFSRLLTRAAGEPGVAVRFAEGQKSDLDGVLDRTLLEQARSAIARGVQVEIQQPIRNCNRATGTMLSGEIASRYGLRGLPDDTIVCRFTGSAGQSFGAFGVRGLTLILHGDANDYVGKGLSGARIVVAPPPGIRFDPARNVICGNVALYGATAGEAYFCGRAGERFAIRNSGARAVVEGVGDHGCEYMTGGRVVVLGETGVNFAAGMSGGIAYVYDEKRGFDGKCNLDMVDLELVEEPEDAAELRALIEDHARYTGSPLARRILDDWDRLLPSFIKVFPMEYRRALGRMSREDAATRREEIPHG